jgi:hypothetical protein
MVHTVESIKQLLATNDKAIGRALIVLKNRQTSDEQVTEATRHLNGRGFRPCHARMGTSMGLFFERKGYLSPKQIAYWRKTDVSGKSRIEIYARQLLEEANLKTLQKVPKVETDPEEIEALTNTYKALQREYADVVDSDSAEIIRPVVDALRAIEKLLGLPAYTIGGSVYTAEETEMQRMEALADREQTRREETDKWRARQAMERIS